VIRFQFVFLVMLIGISTVRADKPVAAEDWIDAEYPKLLELYHWLHQNPELSFQEKETAAKLAELWRADGYEVTTKVGGHGIVGLLKNGDGPTVMLRTDLDALPVTEQTQLPYASTKRVEIAGGGTTGVMHACGHDIHMTNLVGTARYLAQHKDQWSGTLMLIGQPAEERGAGARAMLADELFTRFPKPDFAVALHTSDNKPAGTVALMPGYALANVDSVDITVKGRGGHGSAPHTTIDPVIQAAELIVSLQTIVSREVKPTEPAVVTVGSIHGGTKHNIIGNDCHLQLTVRSYSDRIRNQVLSAIDRKAKAIAQGYGAPEPELSISEGTPSLRNDDQLTDRLRKVFGEAIGQQNVDGDEPSMGGEDFSQYGRAGVPIVMYRLGTVRQRRLDRYDALDVPPPSLHSALYYPDVEPSLKTGIRTMTAAALDMLQK
jgi:hippurate hydrolase